MAIRCGCPNEADDVVFGPVHECSVTVFAAPRASRWVFAVSQEDFTLSPPEPRYMETLDERPFEITLDESERRGD